MTEPTIPLETSLAPAPTEPKPPSQAPTENTTLERVHLPRIAIKFCTQCRWMLRAAYFAQELLSTFNTDLGEVALVPMTGGVFSVTIWYTDPSSSTADSPEASTKEVLLWDRKRDGGFPEVKALKALVRNVIAPDRDLGHTDRALSKKQDEDQKKAAAAVTGKQGTGEGNGKKDCEDCV